MIKPLLTLALLLNLSAELLAEEFSFDVPMYMKGASTYYITGQIGDISPTDFMVDTGSSYMTINEETLALLRVTQEPRYLRELTGVLANGDEIRVPVYSLASVRIGGACVLEDVEVAVFPGKTRQILGLSALLKAAPFIFSTDPPQLELSHCQIAETAPKSQPRLAADLEDI
jgi:predicted aspartyl protease